jgi:sugar phosphate isomerase/epimerase
MPKPRSAHRRGLTALVATAAVVATLFAGTQPATAHEQHGQHGQHGEHGRHGGGNDHKRSQKSYFTGDYIPDLQDYSFNENLQSTAKGRTTPPPLTAMQVLQWAAQAGFKAVDITSYYLPGYENCSNDSCAPGDFLSAPRSEIFAYAEELKNEAAKLGVTITGNGLLTDFANSSAQARAVDVERTEFWTDVAAAMGAPMIRVFSGSLPSDIGELGWQKVTQDRIVPALKTVAAYAASKGVEIGMQNHGDMTATAQQTIQILKWVDNQNLKLIDDTGYFRPFADVAGDDYNWYHDIAQLLPYSDSTYVKLEPAGAGIAPPMDFNRLFTDFRLTSYRGYLPLERLWAKDDPNNPRDLPTPPYDQVAAFLAQVQQALAQTKQSPFVRISDLIRDLSASRDIGRAAAAHLAHLVRAANEQFGRGSTEQAMRLMQQFLAEVADGAGTRGPGSVSGTAAQSLSQQMQALLQSFHDVFGWPVSLTDTLPSTVAQGADAKPFDLRLANGTGQALPYTRVDVSVFPENETYSPSDPNQPDPILLTTDEVKLQYRAADGSYADVPLTEQPGASTPHGIRPSGALLGYLPPQEGMSLRPGSRSIQLRLSVNGVPAPEKVLIHFSLGEVDSSGTVTNPGIATSSQELTLAG